MGCVSSNLLSNDDDLSQLGSSTFSHHIVSLTSTSYGLLNLDPPSPSTTTPPSLSPKSLWSNPTPLRSDFPETINSWELMSGLDADSFRFSPFIKTSLPIKENLNPNNFRPLSFPNNATPPGSAVLKPSKTNPPSIDKYEKLCPPNGDNKVVIYTTTLRGIRETFNACNVVRAAIGGFGVLICERDVSMDRGFREELRELMRGKEPKASLLPRVFVKGRHIGGVEEVMRIVEEGNIAELLQGLPKKKAGDVCDGCGDVRFLPCFSCSGSSKMVMVLKEEDVGLKQGKTVVVRCPDCNENGLVLCPICA